MAAACSSPSAPAAPTHPWRSRSWSSRRMRPARTGATRPGAPVLGGAPGPRPRDQGARGRPPAADKRKGPLRHGVGHDLPVRGPDHGPGGRPPVRLTHTYFVLSGIGGGFPRSMSLASAVWVQRVVDGNPAFEIDSREIPPDWPVGLVPSAPRSRGRARRTSTRYPRRGLRRLVGRRGDGRLQAQPSLVNGPTSSRRDVPIPDSAAWRAFGARFAGLSRGPAAPVGPSWATASAPTRLPRGDQWPGGPRTGTGLYTRGAGKAGDFRLRRRRRVHRHAAAGPRWGAWTHRLLILRTPATSTVPPSGVTAEKSLFGDTISDSAGAALHPRPGGDYRVAAWSS